MVSHITRPSSQLTLRVVAVAGTYYAGVFNPSGRLLGRSSISFEDDEWIYQFSGRAGLSWLVRELVASV